MNINQALCKVFDIEWDGSDLPPLEDWQTGESTGSAPWQQQFGNQHAKGVKHDKDADWFIRVAEHRAQCHWYNNGETNVFCQACPEGYVPGRTGGWTKNNTGANNPRAQRWRLTFADESVITISGLKHWCQSQPDVNYSGLYDAFKRGKSYKHIMEVTKL